MPRFEDVSLENEFPQQEVPEHMVLLSFKRDRDALAFFYWWNEHGKDLFGTYLEQQKKDGDK